MKKDIPYFIIVGSMKSGSSSLQFHLKNHNEIHLPDRELHFFNKDENYSKGLNWYCKKLEENKKKEANIVGEKTPTYSYQENVAERIAKDCPDAKIIWVFRNPVDRAYSNYLHALKRGDDNLSFYEAIKSEDERIKKSIWHGYKTRSIYINQIERFLKYFPKEQMFFTLFEEVIKDYRDDHILNKLFTFLGVSKDNFKFNSEERNKTVLPRFPKLLYYSKQNGLQKIVIIRKIVNALCFFKKRPGYIKMDNETRKELIKYFEPYNKELAKIIDKDLTIWNK